MSYNPETWGAKCGICPLRSLRDGQPVPPEWHTNPAALLIGEAPGGDEIKKGRPFIGKAGIELMSGLAAVGIRREQIALTNVVCCRPPENEWEKLNHQIQKVNKKRIAKGDDPIPLPADCCRPRLLREIEACSKLITLGNTPLHALIGHEAISKVRGSPRELSLQIGEEKILPAKALPTLHPSFVMRSRRWRMAFRADLGRAFRWFASGLSWRDPQVIYAPSPAELRAFLLSILDAPIIVWDVETSAGYENHFEPMADRLRCIGIGVADGRAAVVPFRSIEPGHPPYYVGETRQQIVEILRWFLLHPKIKKGGWNQRYYDRMVVEAQLGVTPVNQIDGIMVHRVAEPELPHGLAYSGSVHTDVHNWKAGHIATTTKSDRELHLYNATDTIVTAMAIPPLAAIAKQRQQDQLIPVFHKLQDVCVGLHKNGLPVDQKVRREWDRKLLKQADGHRKRIRELSGWDALNPSSFPQIADLLFERLQIAPHHYTNMGDPSTDDDSLRAFLSETWGLDEKRRALITAIRDFRRVTKRRGVVVRLRPLGEDVITADDLVDYSEDDESPDQREERLEMEKERKKKGKARAPGLVLADGRVHADWNPHGTTGWRFSSSNPNLQNLESKLRDMFVAPPGFLFVGCDEAQLELRMVAGLADAKYYTERFRRKADPHKELCIDVFGDRFLRAPPDGQKKLRRCVKELTYASLYGAEDATKHEVITSAEDEKTETLIFPDFTVREVTAFSQAWFRRNPEIPAWWESLATEQAKLGYLAEPILGLKCDFLDGPSSEGFLNRLYNYKAQSGGSALVHLATFRVLEQIPFFKWGPGTGLVQQGHDSLVFQVPEDHARYRDGEDTEQNPIKREFNYCAPGCNCRANRVARFVQECMGEDGRKYGLDVDFEGEAAIGKTLKSV